jgi:acyl carrier protein
MEAQTIHRKQILNQLKILIESWVPDIGSLKSISEETNLLTDAGLDSVGILQIVLATEKQFNITIKDHELDSTVFSKMGNFINIIESKLYETH